MISYSFYRNHNCIYGVLTDFPCFHCKRIKKNPNLQSQQHRLMALTSGSYFQGLLSAGNIYRFSCKWISIKQINILTTRYNDNKIFRKHTTLLSYLKTAAARHICMHNMTNTETVMHYNVSHGRPARARQNLFTINTIACFTCTREWTGSGFLNFAPSLLL